MDLLFIDLIYSVDLNIIDKKDFLFFDKFHLTIFEQEFFF